jgi:hypothetical protein
MTEEEILFVLRANNAQLLAAMGSSTAATRELGVATEEAGLAMSRTTRRGYLMNQALFTTRRLLYGFTLAFVAAGFATLKWGFDFNETMTSARISFERMLPSQKAVNDELDTLFQMAKFSPFTFADTTLAFRNMFMGMRSLGISASTVNDTMQSIIDTLAAGGRSTPAALNRVSYALQHMAYLGRLTGQTVNQLGRDGIPVAAILREEFHLTGEEIHNVGKLGIPTLEFLKAFNHYAQNNPVISGAARRQSLRSFQGLFAQFKDSMSQIMGTVERGFFNRSVKMLQNITLYFDKASVAIRNASSASEVIGALFPQLLPLWNVVAVDLHMIWSDIAAIIGGFAHSGVFWTAFYAGLQLLHGILITLNPLLQGTGQWLNILIPLWITYKVVTWASAISTGALTFAEVAATGAAKDLTFAQFLLALYMGRYQLGARLATGATYLYITAMYIANEASYQLGVISLWLRTQIATLWAVMALNPIGLIITAIVLLVAGLVILYFKWKWFHDLVNNTWEWIINHKEDLARAILIAFAPLYGVYEVLKHIYDIWHALSRVWNWFTGGGQTTPATKTFNQNSGNFSKNLGGNVFANNLGPFHGMAGGGIASYPGWSWVGENGPELRFMPRGAVVRPAAQGMPFESWRNQDGGRKGPIIVQVMLNRRVLGEAIAEEEALSGARS